MRCRYHYTTLMHYLCHYTTLQNQLSIRLYEHAKRICLEQLKQAHLPLPPTATTMHDYTADIVEANARFEKAPWLRYCFINSYMRPCKNQAVKQRPW
jgi:hypothetical protein